ncbi:MAG: glycosyltransferase family 2 protein [Nitrososphaerota archaeon]|nr:glycosyltransferase family 2 protein [Nitrososphaerota archaeon]
MSRSFQPSDERSEVSVVVCTYNRAQLLNQALLSILRQDTRGRRFEVVVVDDGSTDGTSQVVERLQRETTVSLRYIRQDNAGVGAARNRGIQETGAPWIAFMDDDEIASQRWLDTLLTTAEQTGADCVGGPTIPRAVGNPVIQPVGTVRRLLGENACMIAPPTRLGLIDRIRGSTTKTNLPGGGNCLVRRSLLETLHGFRELRYGEDLDLVRRATKSGATFAIAHQAIVQHLVPPERLTLIHLCSLATHAGRSQAQIDLQDTGSTRPYGLAVLRAVHMVGQTLPVLVWHLALGNKSHSASCRCSAAFAIAYIRHVLWHTKADGTA